jgi:hypothetical protein
MKNGPQKGAMMKTQETHERSRIFVAALLTAVLSITAANLPDASAQSQLMQNYQELFERSLKEKKGLNFYVRGQTIPGVVVKVIGNEAVEVRNQTYGRIIIRMESIDAVAIN